MNRRFHPDARLSRPERPTACHRFQAVFSASAFHWTDPEVSAVLSGDELARAFDLDEALKSADVPFARFEARVAEDARV